MTLLQHSGTGSVAEAIKLSTSDLVLIPSCLDTQFSTQEVQKIKFTNIFFRDSNLVLHRFIKLH